MLLFRRRTKMKLKIAFIVILSALVVALVWYYIYTGENPMSSIKEKVSKAVDKYYYRAGPDKEDLENSTQNSALKTSALPIQQEKPLPVLNNDEKVEQTVKMHENYGRLSNHESDQLQDTSSNSITGKLAAKLSDILPRGKPSEDEYSHTNNDRENGSKMFEQNQLVEDDTLIQAKSFSINIQQDTTKKLQEVQQRPSEKSEDEYSHETNNGRENSSKMSEQNHLAEDDTLIQAKSSSTNIQQDSANKLQQTQQRLGETPEHAAFPKQNIFSSKPNIPMMNALHSSKAITYNEGYLKFVRSTFYREARPSNSSNEKFTVLLLHGVGLTSTVWINIGTFQILAESGYRALAIDLPGVGKSKDSEIPYKRDDILGYMTNVFTAFQLQLPVVVSPSRSGEYAMPLLMAYPHLLRGLVAIAPTHTSKFLISDYEKLSTPMLVMFGEKDETMLHESSLDSLEHTPNRKIYMIRNTSHACYMDHPPTFHKLLLQFLDRVSS